MTRSRSCNNPAPANGGSDCHGNREAFEDCTGGLCTNWGGWTGWSSCERRKCDHSLVQSRSRICENHPCQDMPKDENEYMFVDNRYHDSFDGLNCLDVWKPIFNETWGQWTWMNCPEQTKLRKYSDDETKFCPNEEHESMYNARGWYAIAIFPDKVFNMIVRTGSADFHSEEAMLSRVCSSVVYCQSQGKYENFRVKIFKPYLWYTRNDECPTYY